MCLSSPSAKYPVQTRSLVHHHQPRNPTATVHHRSLDNPIPGEKRINLTPYKYSKTICNEAFIFYFTFEYTLSKTTQFSVKVDPFSLETSTFSIRR